MGSIRIVPISHPFPSTLSHASSKPSTNPSLSLRTPPPPRAAGDDPTSATPDETPTDAASATDDPFESRLAQVRVKYRSGTGKKAEQRRQRKGKPGSSSSGNSKSGSLMLPPIPLRDPTAAGGKVKVEVGFTPYSERLNGFAAGLGLVALLLVELGSGKGLLNYHLPSVLFLQVYTVASLGAVFVKLEKERISIWPDKKLVRQDAAANGAAE